MQLSEFAWTHRSSVLVVFNNFLLIDATDRSKISSDHHRIFFDVSQYSCYFLQTLPFNLEIRFKTLYLSHSNILIKYIELLTLLCIVRAFINCALAVILAFITLGLYSVCAEKNAETDENLFYNSS